jgi:hypothetical protein
MRCKIQRGIVTRAHSAPDTSMIAQFSKCPASSLSSSPLLRSPTSVSPNSPWILHTVTKGEPGWALGEPGGDFATLGRRRAEHTISHAGGVELGDVDRRASLLATIYLSPPRAWYSTCAKSSDRRCGRKTAQNVASRLSCLPEHLNMNEEDEHAGKTT